MGAAIFWRYLLVVGWGAQNLKEEPTGRDGDTLGWCLLIEGAHLILMSCFFTHQVYQLSCVIAQDHNGRTS